MKIQTEIKRVLSIVKGVPKKVGVTATITSSNSHFFLGHPVYIDRYIKQGDCLSILQKKQYLATLKVDHSSPFWGTIITAQKVRLYRKTVVYKVSQKKVGVTTCNSSSNSHFFLGHLVVTGAGWRH